jgi:hypothetical protein
LKFLRELLGTGLFLEKWRKKIPENGSTLVSSATQRVKHPYPRTIMKVATRNS